MSCPDCKGSGFYTPFMGPPELCQTCQDKPDTDTDTDIGVPLFSIREFRVKVVAELQPLRIPGVTIIPSSFSEQPLPYMGSVLDHEIVGQTWGAERFANNFVAGLRGELLKLLSGSTHLKFNYDISSIDIKYDAVSRCHRMSMKIWMEIA